MISIVFATNGSNVFSVKDKIGLPWGVYPPDMKFFSNITSKGLKNVCIMGRKTFESLPCELPNRTCFVVSRSCSGSNYFSTLQDAMKEALKFSDNISIIGGLSLIYDALCLPYTYQIFHSVIPDETKYENEEYFDFSYAQNYILNREYSTIYTSMFKGTSINVYSFNHPEIQYINVLKNVLVNGVEKTDRTNTGTISCSGLKIDIPLDFGFPILTTKKVSFHAIKEELLWFIAGCTDNKVLKDKNIHIWDGNSTKEFHKTRGLDIVYEEDDCGPIYSFQYRHWGAEYKTCKDDYSNQGIDQLKNVVESLKTDPDSRRHIVSAWNVSDLNKMVLPPCHSFYQFYTCLNENKERELTCMLFQRSSDVGLGLPYNISSYSLLTYIVAHLCGYKAKKLSIFLGDCHVYKNHIDALKTQIDRFPMKWPTLKITRNFTDIDDIRSTDFELENYVSHPFISMKMAV